MRTDSFFIAAAVAIRELHVFCNRSRRCRRRHHSRDRVVVVAVVVVVPVQVLGDCIANVTAADVNQW